MMYFYAYLGIAAFSAFILALVELPRLRDKQQSSDLEYLSLPADVRDAKSAANQPWFVKLRVDTFVAIILGVMWPVSLVLKSIEVLEKRRNRLNKLYPINKAWLTERLTIEAVEQQETVLDPLQAAPALPFGFLNSHWLAFRETLGRSDKLWRFVVPDQHFKGVLDLRGATINFKQGYVLVRRGKPLSYFVTRYSASYD